MPMRMTFSSLSHELHLHPDEDVAAIAGRLAVKYGWNDAEREAHELRLFDIRGGMSMALIEEHNHVPIDRTLVAAEDYFRGLHRRTVHAFRHRDQMEER